MRRPPRQPTQRGGEARPASRPSIAAVLAIPDAVLQARVDAVLGTAASPKPPNAEYISGEPPILPAELYAVARLEHGDRLAEQDQDQGAQHARQRHGQARDRDPRHAVGQHADGPSPQGPAEPCRVERARDNLSRPRFLSSPLLFSPRLASALLTSPRLTSPPPLLASPPPLLASPRLASPRLSSPRLASLRLSSDLRHLSSDLRAQQPSASTAAIGLTRYWGNRSARIA